MTAKWPGGLLPGFFLARLAFMRILHAVISGEFAGSENNCAQLAVLQAAAGHEVRVVIKGWNPAQVERFKAAVGKDMLVVLPGKWPSILDSWLLKHVVRGFEPEIVHTHLGRATRRLGKVARALKIPHVASLHLTYEPKVYGPCNGLICVAGWQKATLKGYDKPVAVVRNWVPQGPVVPKIMKHDGIIRLGSVGRLDKQKGYDVLVAAFRQAFPEGNEPVTLVIVGTGPDREVLEVLADGDARISLAGFSNDVAGRMAEMDAFVSSSRFEGLALVVLEAIKAGLPLLVTDVAGNRELADLQAPGVVAVVAPDDISALAKGLVALVDRLRVDAGRVAYDVRAIDPATVAERVVGFYEEVLAA